MKILLEFESIEEMAETAGKIWNIFVSHGEEKPKRTGKAKGEKDPNAAAGVTSATALVSNGPTATNTEVSGLDDLTGGSGGLDDLDSFLNGGEKAAPVKKLTREEVREKAGVIAAAGGKDATNTIIGLIKGYGHKSVSDMTDAQVEDFNGKLDKLKK